MAMRGRRASHYRLLPVLGLVTFLAAVVVVSYYPFAWDPPRWVRNDVERTSNGSLVFGNHNFAQSEGTPAWLSSARRGGLTLGLEVKPEPAGEEPAAMMMLAQNFANTDFAVAQEGSDLLIWLRRPGSSANGDPPFRVEDSVPPGQWTTLTINVSRELRVQVNGREALREPLPPDALTDWGGGVIVLGDEVHGGGPWRGEIRRAEISTADGRVDYVGPGALRVPESYRYAPEHVEPFPPRSGTQWVMLVAHSLPFLVICLLLVLVRRPPLRPHVAMAVTVGLALLLSAGKFFFQGRHASVGDLLFAAAGAAAGAGIGALIASRHTLQPQATEKVPSGAENAGDRSSGIGAEPTEGSARR
jgi:VanZ family protein